MVTDMMITMTRYISGILLLLFAAVLQAEEKKAVLDWSRPVILSTPVSGMVQKVYAHAGKVVARGDVLVQLDPRIFRAELKLAKARLQSTRSLSEEAKRELDRQTDMYDRTMLSDHDLQVAKNNFTVAQAAYQQAQANLVKARVRLEYSAVRAPFNAIVVANYADTGMVVAASMRPPQLVLIAEANRMVAKILLSASQLAGYVSGQGATVVVGNKQYRGKVSTIAMQPESGSEQYVLEVVFDSKGDRLRKGQAATVQFE